MNYEELLAKIIERGIEAARRDYGARGGPHSAQMLEGAVAGFEAARGKNPIEIAAMWQAAERRGHFDRQEGKIDTFWYWRAYAAELEWIANVISVGLQQAGQSAILPWLPTARGALTYAEIVGIAPPTPEQPPEPEKPERPKKAKKEMPF